MKPSLLWITRWVIILAAALLGWNVASASPHLIVCGNQPGQIYFTGVYPDSFGSPALYYSPDGGNIIQLRDLIHTPELSYGALLPDPTDSLFYRVWSWDYTFDLTTDGGLHWQIVNDTLTGDEYASGRISGEIYRHAPYPIFYQIQRSTNYGQTYSLCMTLGIPDSSLGIHDIALGSAPGEVYILTGNAGLYRSNDYGEHFAFLNNVWQSWYIFSSSSLLNGSQTGEIYVYFGDNSDTKWIWRIYDYGTQIQQVGCFPLGLSWICSPAITQVLGELYFLALAPEMAGGGIMRIYHTANYGQSWDYVEHNMLPGGIIKSFAQPALFSLQVFPNPTNDSFTLSYHLSSPQLVQIDLINLLGQDVLKINPGFQMVGSHQVSFSLPQLSSGTYRLRLQATEGQITHPLTIIK